MLTTVVNVRVTGDVNDAERKLRAVWGGPLCVSQAQRSDKQLRRVLEEVVQRHNALGGDYGQGFVELSVVFDDGTLQRKLDARYGAGLVRVTSALRPYLG